MVFWCINLQTGRSSGATYGVGVAIFLQTERSSGAKKTLYLVKNYFSKTLVYNLATFINVR